MAAQFSTPNSATLRIKFGTTNGVLTPLGYLPDGQKQFSFKGINPDVTDDSFGDFKEFYLQGIFNATTDDVNSSLNVVMPYAQ